VVEHLEGTQQPGVHDAMKQATELATWIREEGGQWIDAGCSRLSALLQ
jgi:hypothetical protein